MSAAPWILRELRRTQHKYEFLSRDQVRSDRTRREALEEVAALRELVTEIVRDVCPAILTTSPTYWEATDWRRRAQRAAASSSVRSVA